MVTLEKEKEAQEAMEAAGVKFVIEEDQMPPADSARDAAGVPAAKRQRRRKDVAGEPLKRKPLVSEEDDEELEPTGVARAAAPIAPAAPHVSIGHEEKNENNEEKEKKRARTTKLSWSQPALDHKLLSRQQHPTSQLATRRKRKRKRRKRRKQRKEDEEELEPAGVVTEAATAALASAAPATPRVAMGHEEKKEKKKEKTQRR